MTERSWAWESVHLALVRVRVNEVPSTHEREKSLGGGLRMLGHHFYGEVKQGW